MASTRSASSAAISEGATLILGPVFSASVAAAAQVAKPANVPVIAFSTDATNAAKGVYLLSFLPQADTARIIGYAAGHGRKSYAALLPNNAYGVLVEASLQKAVASGATAGKPGRARFRPADGSSLLLVDAWDDLPLARNHRGVQGPEQWVELGVRTATGDSEGEVIERVFRDGEQVATNGTVHPPTRQAVLTQLRQLETLEEVLGHRSPYATGALGRLPCC